MHFLVTDPLALAESMEALLQLLGAPISDLHLAVASLQLGCPY